MSYGQLRFLYDNFITDADMLTPASQANGVVSGGQKTVGSGSAILVSLGSYTGTSDLLYLINIDSTTAGSEVGQATFRYRTSDTPAGSWEATGITTTSALYTLSNGVKIAFQSGAGTDFTTNDTWVFYASALFGPAKLLDHRRNTLFRSGASFNLVIDLGSAQNVTAFALFDHNLTIGATLTLQGHTADSWGAPSYSQAVTVQDPAHLYLDETYRYWRIVPVDGSLSYFEAGDVFLGAYTALSNTLNGDWGSSWSRRYVIQENNSYTGLLRRKAYAKQQQLDLTFNTIQPADMDALVTMQEALVDLDTGDVNPVIVHLFYDEADTMFLMDWLNLNSFDQQFAGYNRNQLTLTFQEQVKTRI